MRNISCGAHFSLRCRLLCGVSPSGGGSANADSSSDHGAVRTIRGERTGGVVLAEVRLSTADGDAGSDTGGEQEDRLDGLIGGELSVAFCRASQLTALSLPPSDLKRGCGRNHILNHVFVRS